MMFAPHSTNITTTCTSTATTSPLTSSSHPTKKPTAVRRSKFPLFPFTSPQPLNRRGGVGDPCYTENSNSFDYCKNNNRSRESEVVTDDFTVETSTTASIATSINMSGVGKAYSAYSTASTDRKQQQRILFANFDHDSDEVLVRSSENNSNNHSRLNNNNDYDEIDNDFGDQNWVTFGENDNVAAIDETSTTTTSPNDLSRLSMKVQLGQSEPDDSSEFFGPFIAEPQAQKKHHRKGDDEANLNVDDTITSTSDFDDDYGPALPISIVETDANAASETQQDVLGSIDVDSIENTKSGTKTSYILMLITTMGMNRTQVQNQQRATMMLNAINVIYETIDGSDPINKEIRNELFAISEMRGAYPQFFLVTELNDDITTTFLGDFETIEGINDSSSLPQEILDANPTLLTWDRIPYLSYATTKK